MMKHLETILRSLFTLVIVGIAVWWLVEVAARIGTAPVKDAQGNITVDEFARAKDILLVVLPLVTTVYGYWFGAQGKATAEAKADDAKQQLTAVVASSPDPQLLQTAMDKFPEAFGLRTPPGVRGGQ